MADNIRILGNINDIKRLNRLKTEDLNLLPTSIKNQTFGFNTDYIELFIYDIGGNLISANYNYRDFKSPDNSYVSPNSNLPLIEIDPIKDLENLGYISGEFTSQYNFQTRKISSPSSELFINLISEDRTEISVNSTSIPSSSLIELGDSLIDEIESSPEQKYYLLNFRDNTQVLIINVATNTDTGEILFKLYEPLSTDIFSKSTVWITEELIEPYIFDLNLDTLLTPQSPPSLKGPNFNINVELKENKGTEYENYSSIVSSLTGSSHQRILNYMKDKSYDLNINYTDYSNFIHFSSARKRLDIFYNKAKQIEDYTNELNTITASSVTIKNTLSASIQTKIDNIISNFDGYENYLYFESSSYSWPKSGSNKPYTLLSTGSVSGSAWWNSTTGSADNYDEFNLDHLYYSLPNYIKSDPDNYQQYFTFVDMIGHYFDNVWIYITSINELYNADNNLEKGVSKDLVYDVLRSLGIKLYNSKKDDNFDQYISGLNSGSTLFTDDFTTGSAYLNNIPKKDLLAETYKRIFHNIPLLSKQKGTSTGLQNLINTFGISSSIFSPKEFGGSIKVNEIKGYDNDKITIQNNTITGSLLSPLISLQTTSTSSTEFTSTDLNFVDISFSPQNELNSRLSASIAANNPTFSLDEYIGDPGYAESSSYDSLIQQNNFYISSSSEISGSAKRLDYKGFIELVKYFDNSLFKMLKDFVPARTNTLTGITIKSPILERNKIPQYKPRLTQEQIHEANYGSPIISEDRDYYYDLIEGNKSAFYNGEFTGSYVNINEIFESSNPNSYLFSSSLTSTERNNFNHSDFNITLNNVSSSIVSIKRKKLEKLYETINNKVYLSGSLNNELTSSVELQDSNLSLRGFQNSRYEGTKIFSSTYNTYTSASGTYVGDNSYGKTAVIDHYTRKLGLFSQVKENEYFKGLKRNNIVLKYLVNESGSLIELNKRNKNWVEVQNTFKTGDDLTISLFDNQKYGNQKRTEGIKSIFNSGFSYFPSLYFSGSDSKVYFDYSGEETESGLFKINTVGGVIGTDYTQVGNNIYGLFDPSVDELVTTSPYSNGANYYATNGSNTFPTFSAPDNGQYSFNVDFKVNVNFSTSNKTARYKLFIEKVDVPVAETLIKSEGLTFTSFFNIQKNETFPYVRKIGDELPLSSDAKVLEQDGTPSVDPDLPSGTVLRKVRLYWEVDPSAGVFEPGLEAWVTNTDYTNNILIYDYIDSSGNLYYRSNTIKTYNTPIQQNSVTKNFIFSSGLVGLVKNDKVAFRFIEESNDDGSSVISIIAGGSLLNSISQTQTGDLPYVDKGTSFIQGSILSDNSITLKSDFTKFLNYRFVPSGSGITQNNLYGDYGDVDYNFNPKIGDIVIINYGTTGVSLIELTITRVIKNGNDSLALYFNKNLPNLLTGNSYGSDTIKRFILLSKINDEQNLILTFDKPAGNTSLGLIIPSNLHPDVLDKIDTITKEVKQKLIDAGGLLDAGGF